MERERVAREEIAAAREAEEEAMDVDKLVVGAEEQVPAKEVEGDGRHSTSVDASIKRRRISAKRADVPGIMLSQHLA